MMDCKRSSQAKRNGKLMVRHMSAKAREFYDTTTPLDVLTSIK